MSTARTIIERLLSHTPAMAYGELAEYAGGSRQRVHQIVKKQNLPKTIKESLTTRPCLGGCGKRLSYKANRGGRCQLCRVRKSGYEFTCAYCGLVRRVYGSVASARRSNDKKKNNNLNFCNSTCAGKHNAPINEGLKRSRYESRH